IFEALENDTRKMTERIEKSLTEAFGFSLRVVLRDAENIRMLCEQIPATWENNEDQKTDVLFLWDEVNKIGSVGSIATNPDVDTLRYISGAIVWNIARSNYNKSGMNKFIGTKIYKNMTARNVNTLRKINELIHKP
ncbi:MAG: DUF1697 domain-containing protein, partial [Candidatus Gracilibacteria bacterium]|nr:DUF1697 domain-containing protein [Candidatus Gracilibacteria bacterium]